MKNENEKLLVVFVYGTLKRGGRAEGLMEGSEYLTDGVLEGWRMYSLADGAYPGIVPSDDKSEKVYGELWSVPLSSMPALDRYEGEGSLYSRVTGLVSVPSFPMMSIDAQVYAYKRAVCEDDIVPGGVWEV